MLTTSLPVAQWLERPTSVRKVMGSIPVGDLDFFFVPRSQHVEYSTFSYFFSELKNSPSFFIYHLWGTSTLLILAVCRTLVFTNSVNMTYARHESPSSSVVRASDRCMEGHGSELRFFLFPTLATC